MTTRRTVIIAPPAEAELIQTFLAQIAPDAYQVTALYQDMASQDAFDFVIESESVLVIIHQNADGFTVKGLQEYVTTPGQSARIVVAIVMGVGDVYDAALQTNAFVFKFPIRASIFEQIHHGFDELWGETTARMARGEVSADDVPEIAIDTLSSLPGVRRQVTQVLTAWSSKGGDGKSMLAMEIGYLQANLSGRSVLLIDADMSRGYIGSALGTELHQFAEKRNIATMATVYANRGSFPPIKEFVFNYPPAYGKGSQSQLDILPGIWNQDQANLPALAGDKGKAGQLFIRKLREHAQQKYEFIIFDIGVLIPIHLHAEAIKQATTLLVISSPVVPAIEPTKKGLKQMAEYGLVPTGKEDLKAKARLVLNKYTPNCGFSKDDFPEYISLALLATIGAIDTGVMNRVVNGGKFYMEEFLTKGKDADALADMAKQLINLVEYFSPGTRGLVKQHYPQAAKALGLGRRGIFKSK